MATQKSNKSAKRGVVKSRVMKLIKALESGKYKQATSALARRDSERGKFSFCCLGVACEVAKANGCDVKVTTSPNNRYRFYDGDSALLPPSVVEWYGFAKDEPRLFDEGHTDGLLATVANDNRGYDFIKIAKLFRSTLKAGKF